MGQHGAVGEEPGPVERHDGPAPAPAARSSPRAWPGTAWIGELTATGRSSSGQAGQLPALSGQTAFFRVLERIPAGSEGLRVAGTRSVPDRWPADWSEAGDGAVLACIYNGAVLACIYICIGRGEGSRAIDKTHANETRGTWQKPLLASRPCCRHSSPAELRRVAHMASQELPRGGRERVSGVLTCHASSSVLTPKREQRDLAVRASSPS